MPWARRYIVLPRCLFIKYDTPTACWEAAGLQSGQDNKRQETMKTTAFNTKVKPMRKWTTRSRSKSKSKKKKERKKERNARDPGYPSSARKQTNTEPPNELTAFGFSSLTSVLLPLPLIFCLVHSRLVVFACPQHIKRQVPSSKSYTSLCFALFLLFCPPCHALKLFPRWNARPLI